MSGLRYFRFKCNNSKKNQITTWFSSKHLHTIQVSIGKRAALAKTNQWLAWTFLSCASENKGAQLYNEIVEVANVSNGSTGTEHTHYTDVLFSEYKGKYQILKYLTKFETRKEEQKKNFNTRTILVKKIQCNAVKAKQISTKKVQEKNEHK